MKEWTEIYEQMRGTFAQRAGFVPSEGCDSAVRLYALAAELQSLLMQADWVLDQSFPQTAQGMYLDYHAETRHHARGGGKGGRYPPLCRGGQGNGGVPNRKGHGVHDGGGRAL